MVTGITTSALGQTFNLKPDCETFTREFQDSTGNYLVKYTIDWNGVVMIPSTYPPGAPHRDATIEVYKLVSCKCGDERYKEVLVGKSFPGQYIDGGCFEDRPKDMVNHAKKLQAEIDKPKKKP